MGYLNGDSKSKALKKGEKGEKGEKGVGFHLTADEHYHLKGKRLTNVSAPVDKHDATTKKTRHRFIKKSKAATIYVKNELAKKASQSSVNTALALKADKFELTALHNKVKKLEATVGELRKAFKRRQSV